MQAAIHAVKFKALKKPLSLTSFTLTSPQFLNLNICQSTISMAYQHLLVTFSISFFYDKKKPWVTIKLLEVRSKHMKKYNSNFGVIRT